MKIKLIVVVALLSAVALGTNFYINRSDQQTELPIGEVLVQVKVPNLSPSELAGKTAFIKYCAACHGQNGAGNNGAGPPLVHKIYEPSHHGDIAFKRAAALGVQSHHWPFGNMPPVSENLDDDIDNIIGYVRALQRENGIN